MSPGWLLQVYSFSFALVALYQLLWQMGDSKPAFPCFLMSVGRVWCSFPCSARTCRASDESLFHEKRLKIGTVSAKKREQSEPDIKSYAVCLLLRKCSYYCSVFLCFAFCFLCWGLAGDHIQAKILGNAPYGIYKYKFPRAIRTEDNVGAKVFFYKAFLQSSDLSQAELKKDYLWVTKDELGDYLKSEYLKKVNRFLLDL